MTDLLTEAAKYGILPVDELRRQVEEMRTKKMLAEHLKHHTITRMKNGRWSTYVKDPDTHKQKQLRAGSEEALINKLKDWYNSGTHIEKLTLHGLYEEWLCYKTKITASDNTIIKHEQHYRRFFKDDPFFDKKVLSISHSSLVVFCNELVKSRGLTQRLWTNVKTILYGMFAYAFDNYDLPSNPMLPEIKITVKFKQQNRKLPAGEIFNTFEQERLIQYMEQKFAETHHLAYLAIRLNLLIGLRVAELSTLKWDDIIVVEEYDRNTGKVVKFPRLHVWKEEVVSLRTRKMEVVNHTKTYNDRYVILTEKAMALLEEARKLSDGSGWIFSRNGQRMTNRQIAYVLEKYAKENHLSLKSTHKIRKTYASNLHAAGVPMQDIQDSMGHSDQRTTMGYIFSVHPEEEKQQLFEKALSMSFKHVVA